MRNDSFEVWEKGRGSIQRIRTEGAFASKNSLTWMYIYIYIYVFFFFLCLVIVWWKEILPYLRSEQTCSKCVFQTHGFFFWVKPSRFEVSALAWRGSAKDTLAMEARPCYIGPFGIDMTPGAVERHQSPRLESQMQKMEAFLLVSPHILLAKMHVA